MEYKRKLSQIMHLSFPHSSMQSLPKAYQFKHTTSSPYFPQSNSEAERAIGTVNCWRRAAIITLLYWLTDLHHCRMATVQVNFWCATHFELPSRAHANKEPQECQIIIMQKKSNYEPDRKRIFTVIVVFETYLNCQKVQLYGFGTGNQKAVLERR